MEIVNVYVQLSRPMRMRVLWRESESNGEIKDSAVGFLKKRFNKH